LDPGMPNPLKGDLDIAAVSESRGLCEGV
jgi:hypothetical protein